jgi:hypothetical protein
MEAVIEIAKLDAKRPVIDQATLVRQFSLSLSLSLSLCVRPWQVFFDDSARNIAAGKAAGFHTVIVSPVISCALCN